MEINNISRQTADQIDIYRKINDIGKSCKSNRFAIGHTFYLFIETSAHFFFRLSMN